MTNGSGSGVVGSFLGVVGSSSWGPTGCTEEMEDSECLDGFFTFVLPLQSLA